MGGKTTTSTNKVTIPQDVLDRYNAVNAQAAKVAENPFQKYGTKPEEFVAQFNKQQLKGVQGINDVAGMGAVYKNVNKYLNPYTENVADTTRAQMEQAQEQAQSGALGTAVSSGAFGGDRAGVAAANLANQNQMAMGSTMANIYNQGYTQAIDTSMNDRNRMLGVAGAQLGAGTQMQQTEQAGLDALINQFQQEQGYPFQVAQFLANIAMGTGALSGSTTTSTQTAPFFSDRRLKHDIKKIGEADNGLPIYTFKYKGDETQQTHVGFMADEVEKTNPDAVGLDPSGYKTVDYDKAAQSMGGGVNTGRSGEGFAEGGVAGPYGSKVGQGVGAGSYVPQAFLPVGELMMADPDVSTAHQQNALDTLNSMASAGKSVAEIRDLLNKNARGGVVGGYADGGGVQPQVHNDYLSSTLAAQATNKDKPELKVAQPSEAPESPFSQILKLATTVIPMMNAGGVAAGRHGYALDGTVEQQAAQKIRDALRASIPSESDFRQSLPLPPVERTASTQEPTGVVAPRAPTRKEYVVGNDVFTRSPEGVVTDAYGNAVPVELAQTVRGEIDRQNTEYGSGLVAQPDEMKSLFEQSLSDRADRNRAALTGMYEGAFPVSDSAKAAQSGLAQAAMPVPKSEDESARAYRMAAANRFNAEPTGLAPVDGQVRPMPRPTGLAGADVAADTMAALNKAPAATGVVAPVVTAPQAGPKTNTGEVIQGGYAPIIPLETQLRFITKELQQPEYSGYLGQTYASPSDAAIAFDSIYERSGGKGSQRAGAYANDIYKAAQNGDMSGLPPNVAQAYNHFIQSGMDSVQASGAAGRLMVESYARLDPNARNTIGGGYGTYGIAQHRGDRLEQLAEFAGVPLQSLIDAPVSTPEGRYYSTKGEYGGGLADGAAPASGDRPTGGVKPYEDRNALGKIIYDEDGSLNKNAMLSLFAGLGDMLTSPSPFLLPSIGAGISGAAKTYMAREEQLADIARTQAETSNTGVQLLKNSIYYNEALGQTFVPLQGGGVQNFADFMVNPAGPSMAGAAADKVMRSIAAGAESRGIDLSTATPEQIFGGGSAPVTTPAAGLPVPQVVAPYESFGTFPLDEADKAYIEQAEARSRSAMTPQERQGLTVQAAEARAAADSGTAAASLAFRNTNELAYTVAKAASNNDLGPLGAYKASFEGLATQVADQLGIQYNGSAASSEALLNKLSSLSADQMTADTAAASLYLQNKGIFPSIDSDPVAAAEITAEMVTKNMSAYEKGQFINDLYRAQTGTVKDLTGADARFNEKAGGVYQVEKTNIADLLKYAGKADANPELKKLVVDFFDDANRGAFQDQADAQAALEAIFGALPGQHKVSTGLGRYFVQQGNQ
jgi:hypothetical protein